ncbi:6-bladed beta-propeller [Parabacteroides bouchesdurhonensis]|uniref:6-bladed beta-propeller n=1 Tax=Parabacteroides bouchesdurhonensis TaxID=1936995 RepID=UPI000E4B9F03|nr:6-bladed beta-propeller [Parabacteroides bouchesdurhonensis]RHJ91082.1 6-bladed beta-propeller [Bacteroides sp. AM07-16]
MKTFKNLIWISLIFISCNSSNTDLSTCPIIEFREGLQQPTTLKLNEEIESVSYVPLKVTSDDASLIDGVADYAVTNKYIYVLPIKEGRIALFDRQGNFIKTLIASGQGPGEISGVIANVQADEKNNRLYLFSSNYIWIYTLDGEFIQKMNHDYQIVSQYLIDENRFGAIAFPFMPFQTGSFGLGIFTANGDTITMKNDFYSHLVPPEKSGFTACIAACFSDIFKSILFKTGSNDTVFRIANDKIMPALVLNLRNSDKEVARSLDITDFSSLKGKLGDDKDIFISDIFETSSQYYFRFRFNLSHYVASVNKKTGKTLVEKCEQPGTLKELADANLMHGMLGTKCYDNFPIWGRTFGNNLVQIVTPYELSLYKDKSSISIPNDLITKEEDGNPFFIFYKLKN